MSSESNLEFFLSIEVPDPNNPNEQHGILFLNDKSFDDIVDTCSLWCQPRPILGFRLRLPAEYTPPASLRVFASAEIRDQDVWNAAICEVRKDSDAFRVFRVLDVEVVVGPYPLPYPRAKLKEETLRRFGFMVLDGSEWERRCRAWVDGVRSERMSLR